MQLIQWKEPHKIWYDRILTHKILPLQKEQNWPLSSEKHFGVPFLQREEREICCDFQKITTHVAKNWRPGFSLLFRTLSHSPGHSVALECTSLKLKAHRAACMLAAAFHKGTYVSCKNRHHDKLLLGRRPGEAQLVWPPGSVSWDVLVGSENTLVNVWVNLSKYKIQNVPATFIIFILLNQRGTCKGKCWWWEGLANPTNDNLQSWRLKCLWQKWLVCVRKENLLSWTNTMEPLSLITFIKIALLIILFQLCSL